MSEHFHVDLPDDGRVTGRLTFRELTREEEKEFDRGRIKCFRLKRSIAAFTETYFDAVLVGADDLTVRGRLVDPSQPDWKAQLPLLFKQKLFSKYFDDEGALSEADDDEPEDDPEKN